MATPKLYRLVASSACGSTGRLLTLQPVDEPTSFRGGQFLIADTGLPAGPDKTLKRAYTIVSPDTDGTQLQIAVQDLGPGSRSLQRLPVGALLSCSGPWGRFGEVRARATAEPTLLALTDNAITAGLGVIRAGAFADHASGVRAVWLSADTEALLGRVAVRDAFVESGCELEIVQVPPVGSAERARSCVAAAADLLAPESFRQAWLAGDGVVLQALDRWLSAAGVDPELVHREYYLNRPVAV